MTGICQGTLIQAGPDQSIKSVLTDSRKLSNVGSAAFFAIKGINHDGHQYITELASKGVKTFIIEVQPSGPLPANTNLILVESSLRALQSVARYKRESLNLPVIAITGSNGKTIVKEWLSQMLSGQGKVVRSPRSYNSQLGVPLSVWEIDPQYDFAVFEAGISRMGEMTYLQKVIQPTHGILTNIGSAHEEGFPSINEKLSQKLKLFEGCETLILCGTDHRICNAVKAMVNPPQKIISWSFDEGHDIHVEALGSGRFNLHTENEQMEFKLPFDDEASLENLMHCLCMLLELGFSPLEIQRALDGLEKVDMRLKLIKGIRDSYIIDDTYNNDLIGLETALDFLAQQNQYKRKVVILSEVPQVSNPPAIYSHINQLLLDKGIDHLIGVGAEVLRNQNQFSIESQFYPDTSSLIEHLSTLDIKESVTLVKGARKFQFERVVNLLAEKAHQTLLEINLDAITDNLNFYRNRLAPDVKIMVMVKAFAYGSGSAEVAQLLQFHKVHYLAVAYADEGVTLRKNGIHLPIMVMNCNHADLDTLIKYDLEPEIFEMEQLKSFQKYYQSKSMKLPVHININTGMNRLGFEVDEAQEVIAFLTSHSDVAVKSIFTHLAGADEALHNEFSLNQLKGFEPVAKRIAEVSGPNVLIHALNSAGIIRFPGFQMNMVRLGIGLYGLEASGEQADELRTVGTLKTTISQVKEIKTGETIGYSRKGVAATDMSIATVAIGYADGYSRAFSNGVGSMYINNQSAPVIGNVCMDMTMLDVTGLNARPGDEVIVFGETPSIKTLAHQINTIPYEILTNVSERVKRVYLTE
ncbi:MAG: bifunctional UDP-N-acetylmuramoyl-tripeptide:D-alanyl-D-alanine ligase/alanine racemase [Roseivirga sp.]|nr:bifunctional UDP-N-acetylmuramoyl-tripeptide:D-alanyl-D-alanine ligase/alanine racemase [Roseivirga sp.]